METTNPTCDFACTKREHFSTCRSQVQFSAVKLRNPTRLSLQRSGTLARKQMDSNHRSLAADLSLANWHLHLLGHASVERKGWDSNPRKFLGFDGFQDRCNKPGSATLPERPCKLWDTAASSHRQGHKIVVFSVTADHLN